MEILEYRPDLLSEVAALYNRATARVPHCYPVAAGDLGALLAGGDRERDAQKTWVARDGQALVGMIHALSEAAPDSAVGDDPDRAPQSAIRFLWHERDRRAAGQALLETAQQWLQQQRPGPIWACRASDRYWFYHFKNAFLSDHLDHVGALLQLNGYRKAAGEVVMDWPEFPEREPVEVDLDFVIQVRAEPQSRGDRQATLIQALVEGEGAGQCILRSGGEYSRDPDALSWAFIDWLGVRDEYQGLGLGKHLLQRGLNEMRLIGHRHACITTAWDNYRAFVLYTHFGFQVVDWTYGLRRDPDD